MNKIINRIAPLLLIIVCIVTLILGIGELHAQSNFEKTSAIITSIDSEIVFTDGKQTEQMTVTVQYTANGQECKNELNTYSASMKEGKSISVVYDPSNPSDVRLAGYSNAILEFCISAISLVAFAVIIIKKIRYK